MMHLLNVLKSKKGGHLLFFHGIRLGSLFFADDRLPVMKGYKERGYDVGM